MFRWNGDNWTEEAKLTADDGAAGDYFGYSVALSGNTSLVGAYRDDDDSGSAYVFRWNGDNWTEEAKLTAGDGDTNDCFGISVALSGDTALVGAYHDDLASGSAYVFRQNGDNWTETKLTAGDGAAIDYFGISVALSGDTALVGAPGSDDASVEDSGSAYVFRRDGDNWNEEAKLTAGDGDTNDCFGISVALSGDTALVGAYHDDLASGSAYVFRQNGDNWTETKLTAGDGAAIDYFGISVALSGDTALVGAPGSDDASVEDSGSAYVFRRDGDNWNEEAKLTARNAAEAHLIGYSVALSGDTALVGTLDCEAAYVFRRNGTTWTEEAKLTAGDGAAGDYFGFSVALSGDTALVGAWGDDDKGSNSGSAYVGHIVHITSLIDELNGQIDALNGQIEDLISQMESMYTQEEYDAAYDQGYQAGLANDTAPPTGAVHAHDNYLFPANKKIVDVTVSGYVRDEMSIVRDGGGTGVSEAHLIINGGDEIPLALDATSGNFSITMGFKKIKDAVYNIELWATDNITPGGNGSPNTGLVDETYVRVR